MLNENQPPNPAALTKVLREALPKRSKRTVQHHPALPYVEMPQFMATLAGAPGRAATMLRFLIFTACRTNEVVEPASLRLAIELPSQRAALARLVAGWTVSFRRLLGPRSR